MNLFRHYHELDWNESNYLKSIKTEQNKIWYEITKEKSEQKLWNEQWIGEWVHK